ncbi:Bicyclomycin resistance protein [Lentilactobacillus hilgardii]|uniref:multidrug effflux MFS transporter n=1 Tax=Lentilactobacillus hilgardii TaxID=1588 RepID=UPI00019C4876|nr:multidrug effflux MFS transporter [Lentilactobacillus hilgardii]EEI20937.1 drug resistance transporter, Bcr/CflA subfamily [Lentilactobacillus buchneri ATCC 11577]MCT3395203.1 Bcr/CflA family efflux MFS transporter [Lentilactobacillus hilgardii]QIR10764.1 Bicyclomycin resistance protein [Lentilactobacillus hilgardii]
MATTPSLGKRIWLAFILGTISATGPLSIDLYLPALPEMTRDLQTHASLIQLSLSACLLGLAIGQLISGPLSDKYGRKGPLIVGFLSFGLVSLLITSSHSVYLLIGLRFIQGLAGASGQVLSRAIASDLFSGPLLTKFYSMLSAVNGIFPVISPIIGGYIIKYVEWQGVFILLALIGFIVSIAIWLGIKETLPFASRISGSPINSIIEMFSLLKNTKFVKLVIASGLVYGGLFSYISASSFVFQNYFHMNVANFGFLYAMNGIGIAIGSAIPGLLATRVSESQQIRFVLGSTFMTALALISSWFLFNSLLTVTILVLLMVFQFGMLFTLTTSVIMNLSLKNSGGISALLGLSQNAIGGIMSPVVGVMGSQTYLPMAISIAGCIGLSLILFLKINSSNQLKQ